VPTLISGDPTLPQVSGIYIAGTGTLIFNVIGTINNLANYFYLPNPITYTFGGGLNSSIPLTDLTTLTQSGTDWTFESPINYITANVNTSATSLTTITSLSLSATNLNATISASTTINTILYDVPSYNLINNSNLYPTTCQTLSYLTPLLPTSGYRVWSNIGTIITNGSYDQPSFIPPYYNSGSSSYINYPYLQTWNIATDILYNQELQIVNGLYQTSGPSSGNILNGYINYNIYNNNNNADYSGVAFGNNVYRFATFVWKYPGTQISNTYSNFIFTIKNIKYNGNTINLGTDGTTGSTYISNNNNTQRFLLDYRIESINNNTGIPGSGQGSIWVDGNTNLSTNNSGFITTGNAISATNYYTPPDNTLVSFPSSSSYTIGNNGNDLVCSVSSLLYTTTQNLDLYVYCRIGFPMNANYSFQYVTFNLSN
jgi:hypothetical protein